VIDGGEECDLPEAELLPRAVGRGKRRVKRRTAYDALSPHVLSGGGRLGEYAGRDAPPVGTVVRLMRCDCFFWRKPVKTDPGVQVCGFFLKICGAATFNSTARTGGLIAFRDQFSFLFSTKRLFILILAKSTQRYTYISSTFLESARIDLRTKRTNRVSNQGMSRN
jgi:hypothetical protein